MAGNPEDRFSHDKAHLPSAERLSCTPQTDGILCMLPYIGGTKIGLNILGDFENASPRLNPQYLLDRNQFIRQTR